MEFNYNEFVSHNLPLLTGEQQQKVRSTRLLIAGCGQGSMVAEAAVRTGFERFILADGDVVELSNLNRQAYDFADIGTKKVEALSKRLLRINPQCDIITIPEYVNAGNAASILGKADIIVDFIDILAFEDILVLHREARKQGKHIVAPLGTGWGAAISIFAPDSISLEEMIQVFTGSQENELSKENLFKIFQGILSMVPDIPDYVAETTQDFLKPQCLEEIISACFAPGVAALTAGELAVAAVVRLALGLPVKVAPKVIHFDPWVAFDNL